MVVWDLDGILRKEDFEDYKRRLEERIRKVESQRDILDDNISDEGFLLLVSEIKQVRDLLSRLSAWANLALSENTADPAKTALASEVDDITANASNRIMFFSLWWKHLDKGIADRLKMISGDDYFFESIRRFRPHTLKEKEEQIINLKDITGCNALSKIYDIITNGFRFRITLDGKRQVLTQEETRTLLQHHDAVVRKKAYTVLLKEYEKSNAALSEIYRSLVMDWGYEAKLRNYSSPISIRNLSNDISDEAVEALLKVCRKNTGIFKEYFKLKARMIGIAKPARFDLYAPHKESKKKFSFDEAKGIVLDTISGFSKEMGSLAKRIFDEHHIHSTISPGKRSGAFCYSVTPQLTPYVLLNFTETINDVSTMAHEIGHGVHTLLARDRSILSFHAPLPLAETASIFSEMLLTKSMLKTADHDTKLSILLRQLDHIYASVGRQAFFVLFEQSAHDLIAKGASREDLDKEYLKNLRMQFSGAVRIPKIFRNEWMYIPHIFHTPFYCYAYAFGNLLVLALYKQYEEQGGSFVPKMERILAYGGSKRPADILAEVGIDISKEEFWQSGFDVIKELIDELRKV